MSGLIFEILFPVEGSGVIAVTHLALLGVKRAGPAFWVMFLKSFVYGTLFYSIGKFCGSVNCYDFHSKVKQVTLKDFGKVD